MSLAYIRKTYCVPAKRGARITFCGIPGRIAGADGTCLRVRLRDCRWSTRIHPTWEVEYLSEPSAKVRPAVSPNIKVSIAEAGTGPDELSE
jgi:hypothetical protein